MIFIQLCLAGQLALAGPPQLSSFVFYVKRRDSQCLVQFLMALRHDFKGLRGSIMHHDPMSYVDNIVSELLVEEIRLKSHDDKKIVWPSVFAIHITPRHPVALKIGFTLRGNASRKTSGKRQCITSEYTYKEFTSLFAMDRKMYQTSCTDAPQHNDVAEWKHCHLVETARSYMLYSVMAEELTTFSTLHQIHTNCSGKLWNME
nr:Gag-Pol polyprotein [Tanacetum cinerariifolium]